MSDKRKEAKVREKLDRKEQNTLDVLCIIGCAIALPAFRMLYKGLVLRPRKWPWIVLGAIGILSTILSVALIVAGPEIALILIWGVTILLTIFNIRINREYVLKYNVMVDAGYFEQQVRRKEANQKRMDQTYEHQAQDSMKNAMQTEKRVEASTQIKRPDHPQQIKPKENSSSEKYIPAAPPETSKSVKPAKAAEPAKIAEPSKNDPAHGKRKLDL